MPHQSHLTHFGRAVHKNITFNKTIRHMSVDEVHVIVSAGMPGNNDKAPGDPLMAIWTPFDFCYPPLPPFWCISRSTLVNITSNTSSTFIEPSHKSLRTALTCALTGIFPHFFFVFVFISAELKKTPE